MINRAFTPALTADRADTLKREITTTAAVLSNDRIKDLNSILAEIRTLTKAAKEAASLNLQSEPLAAGESVEWKRMYTAAKDYSLNIAYSGSEFPSLKTGALCVLCQQDLSEHGRERMLRFKRFMEDQSEKSRQAATAKLTQAFNDIETVKIPREEDFGNVLDELDAGERAGVVGVLSGLVSKKERILEAKQALSDVDGGSEVRDVSPVLTKLATKLMESAAQAKHDADPTALAKLENDSKQLSSRKALSGIKRDMQKYVDNKAQEFKFDQAIQGLSTRGTSSKGKEIISAALSPQLKSDLSKELQKLNADHLPLAINITGRDGGARHQLAISAAKKTKPSTIFSEGELSVVAIAGFMAELAGAPTMSPIVLDDPVSSLDHNYSRKIADRLVAEAKQRQVIVFTHNIAFLVEIEKRCAGIPLMVQTVKRFDRTPGKCIEGLPWEALPVKERLNFLDDRINEVAAYQKVDEQKYNKEAAIVYNLLRETWEAFVERKLLNETVKRHDTDVSTLRLMQVEILDDDCRRVDEGMSKSSEWMTGHDKSRALSVNRPDPGELRQDIQSLRAFIKEIDTRMKSVKQRRKAVLEPLEPEFG